MGGACARARICRRCVGGAELRQLVDEDIDAGAGSRQTGAQRVTFLREGGHLFGEQRVDAMQLLVAQQEALDAVRELIDSGHGGPALGVRQKLDCRALTMCFVGARAGVRPVQLNGKQEGSTTYGVLPDLRCPRNGRRSNVSALSEMFRLRATATGSCAWEGFAGRIA